MVASRAADTILILGGAGMVGIQVACEAARELHPSRIVIASLTEHEVSEAVEALKADIGDVEIIGAPGNIFLPQSLQGVDRAAILSDRRNYDALFAEIFSREVDYKESALFQLIDRFRPDVIVDSINTATAISYQDEFKIAQTTKAMLDSLEDRQGSIPREELQPLFAAVRELIISQGIPQIARHIMFLQRALEQTSVRIYVKVGTTGTGGMGFNIPYTHSEDKPSPQLLAKSAIGFAHTGLLFLLARTPGASSQHGAIIKEVKPGAMIGFRSVARKHIRLRGDSAPAYLVNPRQEAVGDKLQLRDPGMYGWFEERNVPLEIIGADTGENGFFSIGEFEAITYPRQMEYVTPEEVARTVILEILGASTGRDVLAAIDGAITEPSYRAGVLREHAIREMHRLEDELGEQVLPSIAVGQLGPPKLSKLLAEAHLILQAAATDDIAAIQRIEPKEMQRRVEEYVAANPRIISQITTIGIPILRERSGKLVLTRGPRISIPPAGTEGTVVPLDSKAIEKYAQSGWVDLRLGNFERWNERLRDITSPDMQKEGSAAFDVTTYPAQRFVPGDIVGWLLTNEPDEQGMVGRRLY